MILLNLRIKGLFVVLIVFIVSFFTACNSEENNKSHEQKGRLINEINLHQKFNDTCIRSYIDSKPFQLKDEKVDPILETRSALYMCGLLDSGYYDSVKNMVKEYDSFPSTRIPGNYLIPVFDRLDNPYAKFFWLKYYSLTKGYDASISSEMYNRNISNFRDSDSVALDLIIIDKLLFNLVTKTLNSSRDEFYTNEFKFLSDLMVKYPNYKKLKRISSVMYKRNCTFLNVLDSVMNKYENFEKELFSKLVISILLNKQKITEEDKEKFEELLFQYYTNFKLCNTDILRYFSMLKNYNSSIYINTCQQCLFSNSSIDSTKARIYESLLFLNISNYKALERNIKNYNSKIINQTYYFESDFRIFEYSMYEMLNIRMLLLTANYKEYINRIKNISIRNTLIHSVKSSEEIYTLTNYFFRMDFNNNKVSFDAFYRKNLEPIIERN